jgi:hypothetical protein
VQEACLAAIRAGIVSSAHDCADGGLAVTLAVQVGVIPILALAFHRVSLISPLANLLIVPLFGFICYSGLATLVGAPLGHVVATVAGVPGEPVVVVRKTLYRIADGNLASAEAPAGLAGAPGTWWLAANKLEPLAADFDVRTVAAKAGTEQTLTEEQVGLVLKALAAGEAKSGKGDVPIFAYFSGGRAFRLEKGGQLRSENAGEAATPVTWSLAHNVRSVQQSLGWNGCTDCHTADSKFFFKTAEATGPLLTKSVASRSAASFMGVGAVFHRIFGLTFAVRPLFKLLLGVTIIATGAVLAVFFLIVAGKLAGLIEKRS